MFAGSSTGSWSRRWWSWGGGGARGRGDPFAETPPAQVPSKSNVPPAPASAPAEAAANIAPGVVEQLPASAYPEPVTRGLYGGPLWLDMQGLQWPYMPKSGVGISGYGWIDGNYRLIRSGNPAISPEFKELLDQGRFLLRVTPTYTSGTWFVQAQAEIVANTNQYDVQPAPSIVAADDVWVRTGDWNSWDVTVGRMQGFDVYPLGMGLDLNTYERLGAFDPQFAQQPQRLRPGAGALQRRVSVLPARRDVLLAGERRGAAPLPDGGAAPRGPGSVRRRRGQQRRRRSPGGDLRPGLAQAARPPSSTSTGSPRIRPPRRPTRSRAAASRGRRRSCSRRTSRRGSTSVPPKIDAVTSPGPGPGQSGNRVSYRRLHRRGSVPRAVPNLMVGGGANYATFHNLIKDARATTSARRTCSGSWRCSTCFTSSSS